MKCPSDCPAYCCKRFLTNVKPNSLLAHGAKAEKTPLVEEVRGISLTIIGTCIHLDDDNKCKIYAKRPKMCKDFYCWETDYFKQAVEVHEKNKKDD
jgi:Fe-S-cluster containining protein